MNLITPSVQRSSRFSADWPGNSACSRLWLTITTGSAPCLSDSLKSRPSSSGMPSVPKYPGEIARKCARQSSFAFSRAAPFTAKLKLMPSALASRHGTPNEDETCSTPGSPEMRRATSR